ncbi:neutral/alkaline ceramidase [Streptomyces sp. Tu 2975]|uniref:neutral/alkaline ceramidase n=1 Tax=Streptomyces sp. Tu 2975 TaxID=2676871 RepID=UPI00135A4111|nr:neutral/alkaline ceramidase [Streptomyces sp. Tu 2975]QIP87961.1 neutral/alkaline ceramidase [Streptomyces sp. Tu 2975]
MRFPTTSRKALSLLLAGSLGALALAAVPGAAPAGAAPASGTAAPEPTTYLVGRGISDVTGEAAEVGMMGYSSFEQKASGIHQRQRSRAFIVADLTGGKRVVYVNADLAMIFQSVQQGVIAGLKARYGSLYSEQNVLLSATHTHAGSGGHSHHLAYNLASLGFQKETYRAIVDGIVESVAEAHEDLAPGTITLGRGELTDASVNRSRTAFERNPAGDKAVFPGAIDPAMTVLRFRQGDRDIGAISWFATHNTSLTNKNTLLSPDNKGYAAYEWEHDDQGVRYLENKEGFVAAFPNTNAGDMSPNLNLRPGSGPTEDEFENTRIIGDRQFRKAQEIYDDAAVPLSGGVDSRMRFVNMEQVTVDGKYTPDGKEHRTCPAMVGASTLAGSVEDGPAIPGFTEGMNSPVAKLLEPFDIDPPEWLVSCQYPKANLVPTGLVNAATPTTPTVLPVQIVKIGQFYLVAGPAEYTIVSGLRIRRTVAQELGVPLENVLMQGYAGAYSQYVTTPEEYDLQQYEGGSTLYGRYTLPAYQQEFASLAASLRDGTTIDRGPAPADHSDRQTSLQTGVVMDNPPMGRKFGDVLAEPAGAYGRGAAVTAEFVTGHPKNNLRRGGTFLEVQQLVDGRWVRRLDDGDWDTTYRWVRLNGVTGTSKAVVTWKVAAGTPAGTYRIVHFGDSKSLFGTISGFSGATRPFTVG